MARIAWVVFGVLWLFGAAPARAQEDVDVAIVLLSDVSRSVNEPEFKLQKEGYVAAFTSEPVINAIRGGALGAIAVAYVEFAGVQEVTTVLDWTVIRDRPTAEAFAARLAAEPRRFWGRTAIGSGIEHGMRMLAESGVNPTRRVIDVCADGTSNSGSEVTEARDEAVSQGIIINALAIINENPFPWAQAHVNPPGGLMNYFRENVVGGPGAFVLEVRDLVRFGEAMTRKLVLEIAGRTPIPTRLGSIPATSPPFGPRPIRFDRVGGNGGLSHR